VLGALHDHLHAVAFFCHCGCVSSWCGVRKCALA
jgi:hypothetical protein